MKLYHSSIFYLSEQAAILQKRRGKACPCPNRRKAMIVILLRGNVSIARSRNPGKDKPCPYYIAMLFTNLGDCS
jgi:hypothetical protein